MDRRTDALLSNTATDAASRWRIASIAPASIKRSLRRVRSRYLAWPLLRQLRCIQLRRVTVPYPDRSRGTPIVRYYWKRFLEQNRDDIKGCVLEIGNTNTVRAFGGSRIRRAMALDIERSSSDETIVADLAKADHLEQDQFDCFVNQFTMHVVEDFKSALYHSIRILKPGAVLLVNFPCHSGYPHKGHKYGGVRHCWVYRWFTPAGVELVLRELGIGSTNYRLTTYGNFFAHTAYSAGLGAEELTAHELDYEDKDTPLLVCARIVKPVGWPAA